MEPGYKQLALSFDGPVEEVRYDVLLEPEPLREEVDFANVQRVFEESKAFQFSAPNKIRQPRDVAYIFKQLETAAVENAFAVLVKNGKPTVIHLGMGRIDATFAPIDAVVAADKKVKAEKVYFIHNHPSGNIKASVQDIRMLEKWRNFFGDKMQPGIIINTRSGLYGEFDLTQQSSSHELVAGEERQYPVKLYSFSKLVFEKEYREIEKVQSSRDVAQFVSSQRLGKRPKLSYLVMSTGGGIQANIHTHYSNIQTKNIKNLSQQIIRDVVMFGGSNVVSYGSATIGRNIIESLSHELKQNEIRLLDHIQLLQEPGLQELKSDLGLGTGTYQYKSACEMGWINHFQEPALKYGEELAENAGDKIRRERIRNGVLTEDEYLASMGYPFMGYSEPALHKGRQKTARAQEKIVKDYAKSAKEYDEKRAELKKEYRAKVERGELRAPTNAEQTIEQANGNPESAATQAARRSAEKRGINWRVSEGDEEVRMRRGEPRQDNDLSEEELGIVEHAKADGTYLKAPNGKPTKLSPKQWAQVRTKAFKDWFGDWELRYKTVENVIVDNDAPIDRKQARKKLAEFTQPFHNTDQNVDIYVSQGDAKHSLSFRSEDQVRALSKVNELIEKAVKVGEVKVDGSEEETTKAVHIYYAPIKIKEQQCSARLVVKEYFQGNQVLDEMHLYNYQLRKMASPAQSTSQTLLAHPEKAIPHHKISDLIHSTQAGDEFFLNNHSKVVDENGEPLVVYHGTAAEFNAFQSEKGMYWFAKNADYSESMAEERGGERVVDVYLNMKNPYSAVLEPGKFTDPNFEAPIMKVARAGGYDGVILRKNTDNELLSDTFYVTFSPAQIKSAKENVGTFDIENPDIRFRSVGTEDNISAFANKYGFDVADVQKYADSMRMENSVGANRAFIDMKRKVRIDNTDKSLGEFVKIFAPIKAELYEKFGDVDALNEKYRQRALDERNVMEAARKRVEEEAQAERKRLAEFEVMSDAQLDKAYLKAIEDKDEARMRDLVNEAARRNGYVPWSEFRMAHRAPSYDETGYDKSMVDVANNRDQIRESLNEQFQMNRDRSREESVAAIEQALAAIDRGENPTVTIYRAVPKSLKEGRVRNGDWVTLSENYAKNHGNYVLEGDYRIMKEVVPAENLYWDGNDINEWGYDDRSDYLYRNTKNNRKLNDLITRDDAGNIIPLSQRFNARKNDVRFRFIGEKGAANLDKAEAATIRLDNLSVAQEMEIGGKKAKAIKMATGWERGADGRWRYEEPDFEVDVKGLARKNRLHENLPWGKEYDALIDKLFDDVELTPKESVRFEELSEMANEQRKEYETNEVRYLDDYVKDKKLFEAYPEFKQVRVEMYNDIKDNGAVYKGATWYASQNLIRVNEQALLSENFRSVLVHEVQHAIQEMEGFARGGNRHTYREHLSSLKEKYDAWSMQAEFDRKHAELGEEALPMEVYYAVRDEYRSLGFEFGDGIFPSREAYDKGFNLWVRGYDKEGYEAAYNEYQSLTDKFGYGVGNDRYWQISGEVEARNVQARLNMPPEERRASLASETEDVAREEQIFLNRASSSLLALGDKLHTPIRIAKAKDVHHHNPDMEKRMRKAKGWFNIKTGEVVVVLDNHTSMEDVTKTVLHETVAHKGLRGIMGEKTFKTMCESVYRSMPANIRQSYLRQYGTPAVAGEEYLAYVAEQGAPASVWQSITSALKVALNSIGIHVNYNYKEVAALLQRSRRHLENKQTSKQQTVRPISSVKKQTVKPRKRGRGL